MLGQQLEVQKFVARFFNSMSVPVANPELLKAQYYSLSRQLPTMYFILLVSTWALAITHMEIAPS